MNLAEDTAGMLSWIKTGTPGFLTSDNARILEECVKAMPEGIVVEVGSFCGQSAALICYLLKKHGRDTLFITVDDWVYEGYGAYCYFDTFTSDQWRQHTEESFNLTMRLFGNGQQHLHQKMRSYDFWQTNIQPIALAYIDAAHSYEGARADFEGAAKSLVRGGFIFMDDSADNLEFGAVRFAKEIEDSPEWELCFSEAGTNRCFRHVE